MNENRNRWGLPVIIAAVGCGCLLLVALIGVGAYALFAIRPGPAIPESATNMPEVAVTSGPSGGQVRTDNSLYDDFSTQDLGWPIYADENTVIGYENGAYGFQILQPDYYDWAYFPIDFPASQISFDAYGLPGDQNGTFGVFCQFQDADNYYYVEIDIETKSILVGQVLDGEHTLLTPADSDGSNWLPSTAFESSPTDSNHYDITCMLNNITVLINGQFVTSHVPPNPFPVEGSTAFFVFAFSFADTNGYKVFFDNAIAVKTP